MVLVEVEFIIGVCDLVIVEVCLCEVVDLLEYFEEWFEKVIVVDIYEVIDFVWEDLVIECSDLLFMVIVLFELKICFVV